MGGGLRVEGAIEMTKLYKLTNSKWETRGRTKWGPGVTHGPTSGKGELCGPGWIHAYTSIELAMMMNSAHANIKDPVCWEAEGEVGKSDNGLKVGCRTLTTVRIVEPPVVTTEHRVRFAILCAVDVYKEPQFVAWAKSWLSGDDRSERAATAAAAAALATATATATAAVALATAALATETVAVALAAEAEAAEAARSAVCAATATAAVAAAAARSAVCAAKATEALYTPSTIDLDALAKMAIYGERSEL